MEPIGDPDEQEDFAGEHSDTTVDEDVSAGQDDDAEPESPEGWAGLEREGPP
ncbi:hypothetical protein Aab01nite_71860 [Paractinoplanes abujensis]|uniref:Uncharacterized protein n=1 Tax=Paractinoplanes abujensis TaxID=882441 RepID=A0A7W7G3H6_9ACTN|nr:hypothetical protein [Actinoplanes abujensis]MBB4694867.1 hypothetical protein [Actinoplanes abujensis]GID23596.1 hypothetical protein Aab01nite_71860 [Actinoplanes abujensis]